MNKWVKFLAGLLGVMAVTGLLTGAISVLWDDTHIWLAFLVGMINGYIYTEWAIKKFGL